MKTRKLGKPGIELSTVGLGTWAHGGGDWSFSWGPQDDERSKKTIYAAIDAGINWVDTAPAYGLGHAEEVLGQALKEIMPAPFVATKCGLVWNGTRQIKSNLAAESIRAECEASLKRLQIDTIDLYQVHWPMPDEQIEEGWGEVAKLIEEGKVRFGGVSNFSVAQMERAHAIHPIASLQPPYSMLARDVEKDVLPFCGKNGIGVVAYSPLQKGLLTGKITKEYVAGLAPDDHRKKKDKMFQEPQLSEILAKVEKLRPIARAKKISLAQLAIAWVLRREEITAAIAGGRTPEQIRDTAAAMDVTLTDVEVGEIEQILA